MSSLVDITKALRLAAKESILRRRSDRLSSRIEAFSKNDPRRVSIINEREEIEARRAAINSEVRKIHESIDRSNEKHLADREERILYPDRYIRPYSFMNAKLGPLPERAKVLNPTLQQMREVESHNLLLAVACVGLFFGLITLSTALPWLSSGIAGLWTEPRTLIDNPAHFTFIHVFTFVYVLLITVFRNRTDKILYKLMIEKEQRWRMGSERWTWPQRGNSYIAAMLSTATYTLFFPNVVLFFYWLPIPLLSKLYLDTYARTGDVEYATLTCAKFNARLIKYLLLILVVFASFPWIVSIFS